MRSGSFSDQLINVVNCESTVFVSRGEERSEQNRSVNRCSEVNFTKILIVYEIEIYF